MRSLEDKILKEVAKQKEESLGGMLRSIDDLDLKIKHVDE